MKPFTYQTTTYKGEKFTGAETIQIDVENNLHLFLDQPADKVSLVVIVGAWRGDEVRSFLQYTSAKIVCFEPNPENFAILQDRYVHESRVTCLPFACGEYNGQGELHEAEDTGNDSLLELSESGGKSLKKTHSIEVRRLDDIEHLRGRTIDLLWVDVQGYEKNVLLGAIETLTKTKSLFLEVSIGNNAYKGSVTYADLTSLLTTQGFFPVADGFDERGVDGNAFFARQKVDTVFLETFKNRIKTQLSRGHLKKRMHSMFMYSWLIRHTPTRLKMHLKKMLGM